VILAALWLASGARADGIERSTVARQEYAYDPRDDVVTLELSTVYSGSDAEGFRTLYRRMGPDGYAQAKLEYYREMYGTAIEAAPVSVMDAGDTVEARERYQIVLAAPDDDALRHRFPIYPDLLRGFFSSLPNTIQQPYPLDGTLDRRDIVTVTAPTLGTYAVADGAVSNPAFTFTRKAEARSGRIEMDYHLHFQADNVSPADFARYTADIERMDHNVFAWIDLDRDLYHRYYRDIPRIVQGAVAIALLAALGAWWFVGRRSKPT
jgi:hypothetical protein